ATQPDLPFARKVTQNVKVAADLFGSGPLVVEGLADTDTTSDTAPTWPRLPRGPAPHSPESTAASPSVPTWSASGPGTCCLSSRRSSPLTGCWLTGTRTGSR